MISWPRILGSKGTSYMFIKFGCVESSKYPVKGCVVVSCWAIAKWNDLGIGFLEAWVIAHVCRWKIYILSKEVIWKRKSRGAHIVTSKDNGLKSLTCPRENGSWIWSSKTTTCPIFCRDITAMYIYIDSLMRLCVTVWCFIHPANVSFKTAILW